MTNILTQGIELATFGMLTVFSFLTLLILVTRLMSKFVSRFDAREKLVEKIAIVPARGPLLIAIISSAIRQHVDKK
ncbi:MAG: OadG family protein [Gammaproteobacteria bacterium]|nr:OadG family protein [Gammaproteobacteria bacterium]